MLAGQQIFLEGGDLPVVPKFFSAIISLGGVGQHFDEQRRIDDRVIRSRGKFERAANDRDIGIGEETGGGDLHAQVARECLAQGRPRRQDLNSPMRFAAIRLCMAEPLAMAKTSPAKNSLLNEAARSRSR